MNVTPEQVIKFLKDMQLDRICSQGEQEAMPYNDRTQNLINDIAVFYDIDND